MSLAFVTAPAAPAAAGPFPALRASARSAAPEPPSASPLTSAACTLAAAAGVVAVANRRRVNVAKNNRYPVGSGYENPQRPGKAGAPGMGQPVYETGVNFYEFSTTVPVPGSEKALNAMIGTGPEVNNGEIWDPLGFSKLYDRNFDFNNVMTYPHVQWLREAEIKHGRCAMLAFVGAVTQSFFSIPGYPTESNYWAALQACYDDPVARIGIVQISVVILLLEGRYYPTDAWIGQMDREPGDLGWDPIKLSKKPNFDFQQKQLSELKNGRLAMMGMASLACEHVIPGSVPLLSGAP